jgi:hypothetical protein
MSALTVLAIDPGNVESAYALIDSETCRPIEAAKVPNADLLDQLEGLTFDPGGDGMTWTQHVAVEMIRSYGMAVGAEVFETCVWIGRFQQRVKDRGPFGMTIDLVYRGDVKLHHCRSSRAKDTNVRQALVDRFAPGQPNHGKGTKADPGWFHGFHSDVWAAYALAVLVADRQMGRAA